MDLKSVCLSCSRYRGSHCSLFGLSKKYSDSCALHQQCDEWKLLVLETILAWNRRACRERIPYGDAIIMADRAEEAVRMLKLARFFHIREEILVELQQKEISR